MVTASASYTPNQQAVELVCAVQNYDWGVVGESGLVAQLHASNSASAIDPDKPYAEVQRAGLEPLFVAHYSPGCSCGWGRTKAALRG
jgi:hypothetical protein